MIVVIDNRMTASAKYVDLVLPDCIASQQMDFWADSPMLACWLADLAAGSFCTPRRPKSKVGPTAWYLTAWISFWMANASINLRFKVSSHQCHALVHTAHTGPGQPFRLADAVSTYCTALIWRACRRAGVDLRVHFSAIHLPFLADNCLLPRALIHSP